MSCTIAIAGKGGTGKTTISSLMVRFLREKNKGSVLAIDADPNSNLGDVLGISASENIGAIIDEIAKNIDKIPAGMTKNRYIEYRVQSAIEESIGLDLLSMGRPEGPGCYCYANNVLRGIIQKISGDYDFVVIDNEAGLEHLSRRTTRRADCMFIISDATGVGINSAKRIYSLIKELNIDIKKYVFIINRVTESTDKNDLIKHFSDISNEGIELVPHDTQILEYATNNRAIMDLSNESEALKSTFTIMEKHIPSRVGLPNTF